MRDLDEIGKKMPYRMPEHFMDEITERCVSMVREEAGRTVIKPKRNYLWWSIAGVAAAALLLMLPLIIEDNAGVPDYESISQCKSIDEVFQTMSTDDLGLFSMMSNYYSD